MCVSDGNRQWLETYANQAKHLAQLDPQRQTCLHVCGGIGPLLKIALVILSRAASSQL